MKNALLGLLVVATLGCASSPATLDLNTRHALIVRTPTGSGSCFPISENSYMTAWHVVENHEPERILIDGMFASGFIRFPGQDAVIVVMPTAHGYTPWPLAGRDILPGERVYLSGYGVGLHWWSEGIATEDPHRMSLDIAPGDSGGPVFDANGDVIAIVVAKGRWGNHHAWVIPLQDLGL